MLDTMMITFAGLIALWGPSPDFVKALDSIRYNAPDELPAVPDALLAVTAPSFPGYQGGARDLGELLDPGYDGPDLAYVAAAYRTTDTPVFGPILTGIKANPLYQASAPAAQVYQCQCNNGVYSWVFIRPEAGLAPITTSNVNTSNLVLDHFRHPGLAAQNVAPGPAWRVTNASNYAEQDLFLGALQASVPNGAANIPLLRLRGVREALSTVTGAFPEAVQATSPEFDSFVLRLNTKGGLAPTTGCGAANEIGRLHRSPYSADYYFIQVIWNGQAV